MDKGYEILRKAFNKDILDLIARDFETLALQCKEENVFRTKNGDVKQIQNCQNYRVFMDVSKHIKEVLGYDGEVLNMQYFIKQVYCNNNKIKLIIIKYNEKIDKIMKKLKNKNK